MAQLDYKLVAGEHGLVIQVKGFNHKLPVSDRSLQACPGTCMTGRGSRLELCRLIC